MTCPNCGEEMIGFPIPHALPPDAPNHWRPAGVASVIWHCPHCLYQEER